MDFISHMVAYLLAVKNMKEMFFGKLIINPTEILLNTNNLIHLDFSLYLDMCILLVNSVNNQILNTRYTIYEYKMKNYKITQCLNIENNTYQLQKGCIFVNR